MIVICDTSPILYLILINQIELLPRLYDQIIIPDIVAEEMHAIGAPSPLKIWITNPPPWLQIRPAPPMNQPDLKRLHQGEQAAILLAQSIKADLLIVDDLAARQAAQKQGIQIIGLLGILGEAGRRNWIDFPTTLEQLLKTTNFRASPQLIQDLLTKFSRS
jgi:predicted nucleic acid-binding protein